MSGSRLPGDSPSNDRHKSETRAETRLDDDLAERFETFVSTHDLTKSQTLRNALDEYLPTKNNSEYVLPTDKELKEAYLALASDQKRILKVDDAESILSKESHPNDSKENIRRNVLDRLDEKGFIGVSYGRIAVKPLTKKEEI